MIQLKVTRHQPIVGSVPLAALLMLSGCGGGGSSNTDPTPTHSAAPTATSASTNTPAPTNTVVRTNTPVPTATATPNDGVPNTVPNFSAAAFSDPTAIDNAFFPLVPGTVHTFISAAEDAGEVEIETIIVEVLDETRAVAGVTTRVVHDRVFTGGLIIEDTYDWYAQDDDGNVWYLGEESEAYEYDDDDELIDVSTHGSWEALKDVAGLGTIAHPGYQMKAAPMVGDLYHQEYYQGEAEDMAEILARDVPVTLSDDSQYSCLETRDFTPLEPGINEHKFYAPGVGFVREEKVAANEVLELKGTFRVGPETIPDFAAASFTNPTTIDNPYFPLVPGTVTNFEADTEDGLETITVEVLAETRVVAGVESAVVHDQVFLDGVIAEDTYDWYAQDDLGNVWYMGEDTTSYQYDDDDNLIGTSTEGAWEAGLDVAGVGAIAIPGYQMKAAPAAGESYRQEYYRGEAEDMAYVVRLDATVEIGGEVLCTNCLQTLEWNPLHPDVLEYKFSKPGVGVILEHNLVDGETVELAD